MFFFKYNKRTPEYISEKLGARHAATGATAAYTGLAGEKISVKLDNGAALTLDVFYGESANAGAVKTFNHSIVKKAAKEFDDCAKWAKKWFPEVEIENE